MTILTDEQKIDRLVTAVYPGYTSAEAGRARMKRVLAEMEKIRAEEAEQARLAQHESRRNLPTGM